MPDWTIYVGAALVAGYFAIAWSLFVSVRKLGRIDEHLHRAVEAEHPQEFAAAEARDAWASRHDFEWIGGFLLEQPVPMFLAVWQRPADGQYFLEYLHAKGRHQEFVTVFSCEEGVTTANTKDAALFPPWVGSYVEVFHGAELEELYRRHQESVAFVRHRSITSADPAPSDFRELLVLSVERQMTFVRSLALWPLRGPYWYFVRRARANGRSVAELYSHRMRQRDESEVRAA